MAKAFTGDEETPLTEPVEEGTPGNYSYVDHPILGSCIRLVLPGVNDIEHRLEGTSAESLTNVIIEALSQVPHVKAITLLAVSGHHQVEFFLVPVLSTTTKAQLGLPVDSGGQIFDDRDPVVPESTTDALADLATTHLRKTIGVENCDVDLSGLRSWPVATGRALLPTNRGLRQPNRSVVNPYVETVRALYATDKPFVVQTTIGTSHGADYVATVRYAVLHPDHAIGTKEDRLAHVRRGKQVPIEEIWHDAGLQTNFDLPIEDFVRTGAGKLRLKERNYMERSDSRTAVDLYTGESEYRDLLRGRPGADTLYEQLDLNGRIPSDQFPLRMFGHLVPKYYRKSPWDCSPGRHGPRINTREVIRKAPGTNQAGGITVDASQSTTGSGASVTTGSEAHEQLLSFAVNWFEGQGDDAWVNSQSGDSECDGGRQPNGGPRRNIEAELKGLSKPSNPLVNYARARYQDRPVDFIVKNRQKAERLFDVLAEPFKAVTEHGTHLENLSAPVRLEDGAVVLVPAEADQARWYYEPTGDLTLRNDDGAVIASGPAGESVETYEYDAPRYEVDDDEHRVVTPGGVELAAYSSRERLLADWTQVNAPFVPPSRHCLSDVTIFYQSGDELTEFEFQASWDRTAESATDRFQMGIEELVDRYTTAEAGESIPYSAFQTAVQEYFADRSNRDAPTPTFIGRCLPSSVDVDDANTSDRQVQDRAFIFPEGVWSPDLPFVDGDDDSDDVADNDGEADDGDGEADDEGGDGAAEAEGDEADDLGRVETWGDDGGDSDPDDGRHDVATGGDHQ